MNAPWSDEERQRKRHFLRNFFQWLLAYIQSAHPETGEPCAFQEAAEYVRDFQEAVLEGMALRHGSDVARQYRQLIDEILRELSQKSGN